jgi:hypothetical protein
MNIYSAKVSTWVGFAPEAAHYWVAVSDECNNRYHILYHNTGKNYTSEKEALGDAMNWFRQEKLKGCLLLGDGGRYDLTEVLIGPRALKTKANALNRRAKACGGWEGNEKMMKEVSARWDQMWAKVDHG